MVEIPDTVEFKEWWTVEIELTSPVASKLAHLFDVPLKTNIKIFDYERKDVLGLIAVHIIHPDFKDQYVEIDKPVSTIVLA